jgi:hypothetical protein
MQSSPLSRNLIVGFVGARFFGDLFGAQSTDAAARSLPRDTHPRCSGGRLRRRQAACRLSAVPIEAAGGGAARSPDATVAAEAAAPLPPSAGATPAELSRDLTPWGMFASADIAVKAVMLGLAFASVLTRTIWLAKTFELVAARRRLSRGQRALATAHSLAQAIRSAGAASSHVAQLLHAVQGELHRSPDLPTSDMGRQPRLDQPIFLTVKSNLTLMLGEGSISHSELESALDAASKGDRTQRVFLRADKSVAYRNLMDTMNA